MIIKKITTGFVIQQYDTEAKGFIGQEFIAGDNKKWEDAAGNAWIELWRVFDLIEEPTLAFDMVQPAPVIAIPTFDGAPKKMEPLTANPMSFDAGEQVLVTPLDAAETTLPIYEQVVNEFMGKVIGIKNGRYVMVKDQDGDVFDCEPIQVHHVK